MKKVITRVSVEYSGYTLCKEEQLTEDILEDERETIAEMIINALDLDNKDVGMLDYKVNVNFEVREAEEE